MELRLDEGMGLNRTSFSRLPATDVQGSPGAQHTKVSARTDHSPRRVELGAPEPRLWGVQRRVGELRTGCVGQVVGVDAGDCSASQRYSASCVSPLVDVFAAFESCRAHSLFLNP